VHARGEVGDAEVHRFEAAAGLRDRLDVRHAQGRLDQHLDPDAMRDATGGLDLGQQGVHEVDIRRDPDFRTSTTSSLCPACSTTSTTSRYM